MVIVLGALAVAAVLLIAAWAILRESRRLAAIPPRPTYEFDKAVQYVVDELPDAAAATLTVEDVRLILDLQLEYLRVKGLSGTGGGDDAVPGGVVVVGGSETVEYILGRADAAGTSFIPE
ncbi:MAG: hypothetical protein ACT4PI_00890, partial [Actinomycetota bacterium]